MDRSTKMVVTMIVVATVLIVPPVGLPLLVLCAILEYASRRKG